MPLAGNLGNFHVGRMEEPGEGGRGNLLWSLLPSGLPFNPYFFFLSFTFTRLQTGLFLINGREKPGRLLDSYTASKMQEGGNRFGEERAKEKVDEN